MVSPVSEHKGLMVFSGAYGRKVATSGVVDEDIDIWPKEKSGGESDSPLSELDSTERVAGATFFTICRNSDLEGMVLSIKSLEERFNHRYHYPWVFANDEPFTEEFRREIARCVSGDAIFTTIPKEYWNVPEHIDKVYMKRQLNAMEMDGVLYGGSLSYRQMCRFNSGFFYKLKALQSYTWYWRVEPDVSFTCDIREDYFRQMVDGNKTYGFALAMTEDKRTVRKLWNQSRRYFESLAAWNSSIPDGESYAVEDFPDNSLAFLEQNTDTNELVRGDFNLCHYWTNFEIANLDFFRSDLYEGYFQSLDSTGNFFYERWGDAPVHSIAVGYLLTKDQIQYFDNSGYFHQDIGNCPRDRHDHKDLHCMCRRAKDFSWKKWSCVPRWFKALRSDPPQQIHY